MGERVCKTGATCLPVPWMLFLVEYCEKNVCLCRRQQSPDSQNTRNGPTSCESVDVPRTLGAANEKRRCKDFASSFFRVPSASESLTNLVPEVLEYLLVLADPQRCYEVCQ